MSLDDPKLKQHLAQSFNEKDLQVLQNCGLFRAVVEMTERADDEGIGKVIACAVEVLKRRH